jgi:hypothetical protein
LAWPGGPFGARIRPGRKNFISFVRFVIFISFIIFVTFICLVIYFRFIDFISFISFISLVSLVEPIDLAIRALKKKVWGVFFMGPGKAYLWARF